MNYLGHGGTPHGVYIATRQSTGRRKVGSTLSTDSHGKHHIPPHFLLSLTLIILDKLLNVLMDASDSRLPFDFFFLFVF